METIPISTRALSGTNWAQASAWRGVLYEQCLPHRVGMSKYGPYYVVDANNAITTHGISDLGELAREVGVLKPFEHWAEAAESAEGSFEMTDKYALEPVQPSTTPAWDAARDREAAAKAAGQTISAFIARTPSAAKVMNKLRCFLSARSRRLALPLLP